MKKFLYPLVLSLSLTGFGVFAQTISNGDLFGSGRLHTPDASPTPAPGSKKSHGGGKGGATASGSPQGPTVIDSENMDYDEKTRIAIFTGENYGVYVKDPSFTVYCDKLTAHMRKVGAKPLPGAAHATVTPAPAKGKSAAGDPSSSRAGGLQSALAEGAPNRPVVIVQDKAAASPGETPQHNVGIAARADYNADTGDVTLTGWPRVTSGINTQIATSEKTVMVMNKDGHTMTTHGSSRTVIQQPEDKKSDSDSSSASPTAQ